jgi:ribosomal protein L3 glutamine methyltransferase
MTLIDLIENSAARLTEAGVCFGHGTTNARDEAAWLALWSLGLALDTQLDGPQSSEMRPISAAESENCATLIEARIASRKPAAYLVREAWLQGVCFYVDERAIVPRSLIAELLVEGSLDYWLREDTHAVLDLCTGNGSLAVIAAMVYPDTTVDASDISKDALAVAAINVERHHLGERVHLVESDGLTGLQKTYDLILCNPPYVNAESMSALPLEYQAEPAIALDGNRSGGVDGMDFVRRLLKDVSRVMNPGAVLVLEIGHERSYFEAAFPALAAIWLETSAGEDQVLLLTREALSA